MPVAWLETHYRFKTVIKKKEVVHRFIFYLSPKELLNISEVFDEFLLRDGTKANINISWHSETKKKCKRKKKKPAAIKDVGKNI